MIGRFANKMFFYRFPKGISIKFINVYANYDLETGGPEQSLTVVLVCGDGNEFEFSYPLTASDREQLREKMEGYCQSQAGMSLDNYRQELCSEESSMEQGPQM